MRDDLRSDLDEFSRSVVNDPCFTDRSRDGSGKDRSVLRLLPKAFAQQMVEKLQAILLVNAGLAVRRSGGLSWPAVCGPSPR